MAHTEEPGSGRLVKEWQDATADAVKRFIPFNLDNVEWRPVAMPEDGSGSGELPSTLAGKVDFKKYYDHGMWTAFIDAGAFNLLGVKLAPNYTIQRHHHNIHQLVFVHSGEVYLGARKYGPGDAYFTRAGHTYSVTAGPEGSIAFEVRAQPIGELTTIWDEDDPAKWVHGRRPGGPAASLALANEPD